MKDSVERISLELTFVIKNPLLKKEADFISTCDEIVSISLQVRGDTDYTVGIRDC